VELIAERMREAEIRDHDELQVLRDRVKTVEGENLALQKRTREQDAKLSNVERASTTARQNLAQAQQRASDWEKRAKDFDTALEKTNSTVSQLEDSRQQLESELLATQTQAEKRDSEHQVSLVRSGSLETNHIRRLLSHN
jgi:23S rRNA pseudoU1915 N3-methylase RlmH